MEKFRKSVYLLLCVIAVAIMIASLLSVFRNTPNRFLKMLDFPRIQIFITSVISIIGFVLLTKKWRWYDYALVVGLVGGLITNGVYLRNYTSLVATAVPDASDPAPADQLRMLLLNVKMDNREAQPILDLLNQQNADVLLLMEVDDWWDEQLQSIEDNYPYKQESINAVSYGMTLYSRFPLTDLQVNYLNNENVPSFDSRIELPNGRRAHLYAMHPVPPTRFEDLPDNAGQEEVAFKKLGRMIQGHTDPVIVAGDFNDVVWGYTNELTETDDLLRDVRVGRGFYNSYDAGSWFLRWPLDHVFVTEEFAVNELERLPNVGSDHFPILVELSLPASR